MCGMGNVDCEIYISYLIGFFEKNPNDLITLIGNVQKKEFYDLLREQCEKNSKTEDDCAVTRKQMIDIVLKLKIPELEHVEESKEIIEKYIQKTKWGKINLN